MSYSTPRVLILWKNQQWGEMFRQSAGTQGLRVFVGVWEGKAEKRKRFQVTRQNSLSSNRHARSGRGDSDRGMVTSPLPDIGFIRHPVTAVLQRQRNEAHRLATRIQAWSPRSGLSLARSEYRLSALSVAGSSLPAYFFDSIPNPSHWSVRSSSPVLAFFRSRGRSSNKNPFPGPDSRSSH